MNIPSKVKIGFNNYTVNIISGNIIDGNKVCYGNIEFEKGFINISNLYSEDMQKCTFIHECLHGLDDIVEAHLTEEQIRLMAKGLYSFIKENNEIFADITQLPAH